MRHSLGETTSSSLTSECPVLLILIIPTTASGEHPIEKRQTHNKCARRDQRHFPIVVSRLNGIAKPRPSRGRAFLMVPFTQCHCTICHANDTMLVTRELTNASPKRTSPLSRYLWSFKSEIPPRPNSVQGMYKLGFQSPECLHKLL